MNILIADDDPVFRRMLEGTLTQLGHSVIAVADGFEAQEALLAPRGPHVAILDWQMPGLDGLAVCRSIRQRSTHYVYIILLTAQDRREDMVTGFDAQVDDFLTKPFDVLELRARLQSGERILASETRLLQAQEALRHEALHDRLTGLWNRGMVLDHLEREAGRARRTVQPLAVALTDIDHFKAINDRDGHDAGDQVLVEAARRMKASLRETDGIGRYGGEEFLMILSPCDEARAAKVIDRVRRSVGTVSAGPEGRAIDITLSAGVACSLTVGCDPAVLVRAADKALYLAKANGRNRTELAPSVSAA